MIRTTTARFPSHVVGRRWLSSTATTTESVQSTALYAFHQSLGGDMVPFAGYSLPIMYHKETKSSGILNEHLWCRSKASIFDVSHMGQVVLRGTDREHFLESLVVGDIHGLGVGHSCLSLLTNAAGGIIDDTVITNAGDYIYMVINGATKITDIQHLETQMRAFSGDVQLDVLDASHELIALQGPGAVDALRPFLPPDFDTNQMKFMSSTEILIDDVHCRMTRYVPYW